MIKFQHVSMDFGSQAVFKDADFVIDDREKIGLIGSNGSGKSTLLKLITQSLEPSEGRIQMSSMHVGYLEQHLHFVQPTVLEEVCRVLPEDRQYEEWKAEKILMGLGFSIEDMLESPDHFSGGYQIRLNLAKILLQEPNILLLDEPTNYLDIYSIRWLARYLKKWSNALILITHDRSFMDQIITHTLYIHRKRIIKTSGTTVKIYDLVQKQEEVYERERVNIEKARKKTEDWIARKKAKTNTAKLAQSRQKQLDRADVKEKLSDIPSLNFQFPSAPFISNQPMIRVKNLSFGYDKNIQLIQGLNFLINFKDRVCIIGKNGKGKSTLLKLLIDELSSTDGSIIINPKVTMGYFGQMNKDTLDHQLTIYDELYKEAGHSTIQDVRKVCGLMMFPGSLAEKKIDLLSGGEKSRVILGKILLQSTNMLFLDEPTNHLDMESSDALLRAVQNYNGAVVMVTHNEYYLKRLATHLIVFDEDKVRYYQCSYDEFLANTGWKES